MKKRVTPARRDGCGRPGAHPSGGGHTVNALSRRCAQAVVIPRWVGYKQGSVARPLCGGTGDVRRGCCHAPSPRESAAGTGMNEGFAAPPTRRPLVHFGNPDKALYAFHQTAKRHASPCRGLTTRRNPFRNGVTLSKKSRVFRAQGPRRPKPLLPEDAVLLRPRGDGRVC